MRLVVFIWMVQGDCHWPNEFFISRSLQDETTLLRSTSLHPSPESSGCAPLPPSEGHRGAVNSLPSGLVDRIASAADRPLASELAIFGEIGLLGEVRAVSHVDARIGEARKMGFTRCVVPAAARQRAGRPDQPHVVNIQIVLRRQDPAQR